MRGRGVLAKLGLILSAGTVLAQPPGYPQPPAAPMSPGLPQPPVRSQPVFPQAPAFPQLPAPQAPLFPPGQSPVSPGQVPPGLLPPMRTAGVGFPGTTGPSAAGTASPGTNPIAMPQEFPLPLPENKLAFNAADVAVKRAVGSWQLWAGHKMLRDFGDNETNARDAANVLRDLRPTEWVTIGGPKVVVEYGLVNGRPPMLAGVSGPEERKDVAQAGFSATSGGRNSYNGPAMTGAGARQIIPIDTKSVRVEAIRGAWCMRDDWNIHFNFGPVKADAEQAVAVVRRYGFNRVGVVGAPAPVMNYLFAADASVSPPQGPIAQLQLQAQIDGLTRVGIPVGGVGYVGEMVPFDNRKLAVRKEGHEWVVAAGREILGRFGPTEWAARDAMRTMQDSRFTEYCKLGSAGLTFFLSHGKAPTRVPLNAQGKRFDLNALKVKHTGQKWSVTENGRQLFDCASAEEGETIIRVLRHYRFDQLCHLGPTPRIGVSYLAHTGH